ncbi:hypothetical protein ABEB36_013682 [Hypothenemus hampei]|uniref:Uncharacterized protein n=1 Tax=Hypothenemus hampei TaxID=57062 RepID=A0ABD1E4Z3_HYPHA
MESVTLSNEQFQQLLQTLTVTQPRAGSNSITGNFTTCTSRFSASADSDVKAFVDAIQVFKDCAQITDVNALKGLPMLLDGFAATWFQGVKAILQTWQEAISLLKTTFGPCTPPYRIFKELFKLEHKPNVKTDIFVCKCRTILAQLRSDKLDEETQLDMVYGLLNVKIRKHLPRDKMTTFGDLLAKSRLVEETTENLMQ